jgi:hypothetical protein
LIAEGTADELENEMAGSIVELSVHAHDLDKTLDALTSAYGAVVSFEAGRDVISVPAPNGPVELMAVSRTLDSVGVVPTQLDVRRPTLDDVFLKITGNEKGQSIPRGGRT